MIKWREHDDIGAVLFPDHLPEPGHVPFLGAVSHNEQFGSEVGINIVSIVLMRIATLRVGGCVCVCVCV